MITFIPFPHHTHSIPETIWTDAKQVWITQLNTLLDTSDEEFSDEWINNTSLSTLLTSILDVQMDKTPIDPALSRAVFVLYVRAASLLSKGRIELAASPLFSSGQLTSFAAVYNSSNPVTVRQIFSQLLDNSPMISGHIKESLTLLTDCLVGLPKAISTQPKRQALERAFVVCRLLDVLVSATLYIDGFFIRHDIEKRVLECYHSLETIYQSVSAESKDHPFFYHLKYALVSTFNSLMDRRFFLLLGFVTDTHDPTQLIPLTPSSSSFGKTIENLSSDKDAIVDHWSKYILELIENDGLEGGKGIFEDAPMVMDWEVAFCASAKLDIVNSSLWGGEDERIEFLKMSMQQVRDMSQGISPWHSAIPKKPKKNKQQTKSRTTNHSNNTIESAEGDNHVYADADADANVEQMTFVSQVLDVFPDLGIGFIEACLEENQNDPERVVMQLLEDTLPPSLATLDRSMKRQTPKEKKSAQVEASPHGAADYEKENLLDSRRNIFDNDEFDMLRHSVDKTKIHLGKKTDVTAKSVIDDKSFVDSQKSNLLQRVVNMYEEDYDDTYDDVDYVGGAVGSGAVEDNEDVAKPKKEIVDPNILNESDLVHWFTSDPESFARSPVVRRSAKRTSMREKTHMTDEQLEGWAVMFARNPRKQRILDKYALFDGSQAQVSSQVSEAQKKEQLKNKKDNRPPPTEAKDRSYKDKNKARFGNHNRKKMHDKKLVKAGGAGPIA
ncbi:hypothetical protein F4703DRAFT_1887348 [Phycomyces blakesleeanus]